MTQLKIDLETKAGFLLELVANMLLVPEANDDCLLSVPTPETSITATSRTMKVIWSSIESVLFAKVVIVKCFLA